jgi:hypothetical protein
MKPKQKQSRMSRFRFVRKLGDGTHGSVKLYENLITGRLVGSSTRCCS